MDDDRLASELERRSRAGSPRPDWAWHDLLPAVRHEIDARPQPVVTSRWSPRLGVAAVVVALLVMVVAVPRLVSQLPASSAAPSKAPVLTTADFTARLAGGELDGQTVLVDGGIVAYDGPMIFGAYCGPNGPACLIGQLEGVTPRVVVSSPDIAVASSGDSTVELGSGWPWWTRFAPPIRGILLFSVGPAGGVEYVGRASLDGDQLIWSVGDAAALDIISLGRDDVILVDGWLGGYTITRCLSHPSARIEALPNRVCSAEWVATSPNPDGRQSVQVQPGAYNQFAPNPTTQGDRAPRKATYALAPRLEGECGDVNPPCWQWTVVGRVDTDQLAPVPTPGVAATIRCSGSGTRSVTVVDNTGLVADCRTLRLVFPSDEVVRTPTNPEGDLYRLRAIWGTTGCVDSVLADFSRDPNAEPHYVLAISQEGVEPNCSGPPISVGFEVELRAEVDASAVAVTFTESEPAPTLAPSPSPTPSPAPTDFGSRTFICAGSEALGDPGIKLVDHSGRIGSCSMATADSVPDESIEVSTTRLPGQLAVDWNVNAGCPGNAEMEFWGPVDQTIGPAEYVLRVARTTIVGETCTDLANVRRVQLGFTVFVQPSDIRALLTAESVSESTTSAIAGAGSFDLLLAAPLSLPADEPIDVTSRLTYTGSDPIILLGSTRPDFAFLSLTGGPSLHPYGSLLPCPHTETQLSSGDTVLGQLEHPQTQARDDPNNAYFDEYAYDGEFRLPAGTYLIITGVAFSVGSDCQGDHVALRTAIVIRVGGFASSGAILRTDAP